PYAVNPAKNGILHRAVYRTDGKSPALGALVLAEIMEEEEVLSNYPISAWVGDDLPGDEDVITYDPERISYKQYAAIVSDCVKL
ncbi:MAG: hypothetical protein ABIG61_17370, partial [Planctomycetota bacterium]